MIISYLFAPSFQFQCSPTTLLRHTDAFIPQDSAMSPMLLLMMLGGTSSSLILTLHVPGLPLPSSLRVGRPVPEVRETTVSTLSPDDRSSYPQRPAVFVDVQESIGYLSSYLDIPWHPITSSLIKKACRSLRLEGLASSLWAAVEVRSCFIQQQLSVISTQCALRLDTLDDDDGDGLEWGQS